MNDRSVLDNSLDKKKDWLEKLHKTLKKLKRRPRKMSKNYLKSLNPFKIFSILKERSRRFKKATNEEIPQLYSVNALAKELHPDRQFVKIAKVESFGERARLNRVYGVYFRLDCKLSFSAGTLRLSEKNKKGVPLLSHS